MVMNKVNRLIFSILACFSLTACFSPKNVNESSKQDATIANTNTDYQVDENIWNDLFEHCQCLNPFSNFTVSVRNAGKLLYGNTDVNNVSIMFANGEVYVDGYRDEYYIFEHGSNEASGYYNVKMYREDLNEITGNSWEFAGEGEALISDLLGIYVTICFTVKSLTYTEFTFDEVENVYTCPSFTSKCALLPNDLTYTIENMRIQFYKGEISHFDYYVKDYKIKISSMFLHRGSTVIEAPNIPVE